MKKAIRPTPSIVKGALFNILGDIQGLVFFDLFAGTGQIGLEAERRGAKVLFVEKDPARARRIMERCKGRVLRGDAIRILGRLEPEPDIIFADPPYSFKRYEHLIEKALRKLKPGGILVLEHERRKSFNAQEERVYGDTVLSLWRKGL